MFNSVNSTIDTLTNNGVDGTEKGALARDVIVSGIKRNIRSIVTDALPGFEDNPRYISELGIRTERDGSLSLTEEDFKENFSREPILFDVMVNSLARSNNPLSNCIILVIYYNPKGGIYSFSENSVDGNNASLNGVSLSGNGVSNGIRGYAAVTGDTAGLRIQASGAHKMLRSTMVKVS